MVDTIKSESPPSSIPNHQTTTSLNAASGANATTATPMIKDDTSPVTIADYASQAIICRALSIAFPNDIVIAEEDSTQLLRHNGQQLREVAKYVQMSCNNEQSSEGATTATTIAEKDVINWIDHGSSNANANTDGAIIDHDEEAESSSSRRGSKKPKTAQKRFWTLDPIDGTKGFIRGDQYAIALALIDDNEVKVGILACPALKLPLDVLNDQNDDDDVVCPSASTGNGVLFVAVRGEGTTMESLGNVQGNKTSPVQKQHQTQSIRLGQENGTTSADSSSTTRSIPRRMVESYVSTHCNQTLQENIAKAVGITTKSLRMDSQAKYGIVASGYATLYLRMPNPNKSTYKECIWDHAAGSIVVEEAGGYVTDMNGKRLDFTKGHKLFENTGVIVSNNGGGNVDNEKNIHDKVLEALKRHERQESQS